MLNSIEEKNITTNSNASKMIHFRALRYIWQTIWGGTSPSILVVFISLFGVVLMMVPLIYIFIRALQGGRLTWIRIFSTRIPILFWNTFTLTISVTLLTIVIGVITSWLVVRTDIPGRKIWKWALAMPLVIPPYVGALTYIIVFGPTGLLRDLFGKPLFNIYSLHGAIIVFTVFTFPYIYLIVSSSLTKFNSNYEEAALSCGISLKRTFFKVILPMLRPAIGGGALLVALYVISDFGAIAMLRYNTFSSTIYYQIAARFDRSGAAIISVLLIVINLSLLWINSYGMKSIKFQQNTKSNRVQRKILLGKWKAPALIFILSLVLMSVILPISILSYWTIKGIQTGVLNYRFWGFTWNSLSISIQAAVICMLLSVPVAYLKSRHPSKLSSGIYHIIYSGYVIPGVIIALGSIFIFNQFIPWLYATPYMVLMAYIIRFLPQNLQTVDSVLAMVSPKLDEAGKSLGKKNWQIIVKIITPIISPGVLAGGALVFVSSIKELPATLLLRPAGFDTLAVRIWLEAHEGFYYSAAPSAILIIIVSIIPLWWILKKY